MKQALIHQNLTSLKSVADELHIYKLKKSSN